MLRDQADVTQDARAIGLQASGTRKYLSELTAEGAIQRRLPQKRSWSAPTSSQLHKKCSFFYRFCRFFLLLRQSPFYVPFSMLSLIITKWKRQRLFQRCPLGGETIPYISFSIRVFPGEEGNVICSMQGFAPLYNPI